MGEGYSLKRLDALEAKLQRQKYIEENYPDLENIAKINLFTSCIYQGQMTLLHFKGNILEQAKKQIYSIVSRSRPDRKSYAKSSYSEKIWITIAKISFWGTCRIKNLLKKGF